MYANEFETNERRKLTEIKNYLQHVHTSQIKSKAKKVAVYGQG